LAEAERLADRIIVMKTGLVAMDTPEALRERLFGHRVRIVADHIPETALAKIREFSFLRDLVHEDGVLHLQVDDPQHHNPQIVDALTEAGAGIRWVTDDGASLEDIYLELVDEKAESVGDVA
jgi:ABC-type multidrug transport system ATPase subunit